MYIAHILYLAYGISSIMQQQVPTIIQTNEYL